MKPIRLTIAGLHSFRERQTIDFERLCDGGLFGIFGPTGSGKSTILDAMTLALYGNVERAPNQTVGIMNHAENELFVSFTFQIGAKRYTVERAFKRSSGKDYHIKATVSRLIEEGEPPTVLANKAKQVDDGVKTLLGLEMKDFTRAVVLPQGKFAEFLSLKGSERRQMLQRLFHLEQYGNELNKKLKYKLAQAKSALEAIKAEQAGLGNAAKEEVEKQKEALAHWQKVLEEAQKALAEWNERFEHQKQLWQWQCEKENVATKLTACRAQEKQMLALERTYARSEEAERIVPYIEQWNEARGEAERWAEKASELARQLTFVRVAYEQARAQYEHARVQKSEQEPKWVQKREQLVHVQQTIARARAVESELDRLAQQEKRVQAQLEKAQAALEKGLEDFNKWSAAQAELKKEWERIRVDVNEKQQLERAHEQKRDIDAVAKALREVEKEWEMQKEAHERAKAALCRLEKQLNDEKKRLAAEFHRVERLYGRVCEREKQLTAVIYAWKEEKKRAERARLQDVAATLAEQLRAGEPCPVCGSLHHPNVAKRLAHSDERVAELETTIERGERIAQRIQTFKMQLQQLVEQLERHIAPPPLADAAKDDIDDIQTIAQWTVEEKALYQDVLACRDRVQTCVQQLEDVKRAHEQQAYACAMVEKQEAQLADKAEMHRFVYEQEKKRWEERYTHVSFAQFDAVWKELKDREKDANELRDRIDKSVVVLENKRDELERLKESVRDLERQRADCTAQLKMRQQQYEEYRRTIPDELWGEDIAFLIEQAERQIATLKQEEERRREQLTNEQEKLHALQREKEAAHVAASEGEKRKEQAASALAKQLQHSSFATTDEALAARLQPTERARLRSEIEQYKQLRAKLENEWQRLNEAMNGETITEAMWEETKNEREKAKQFVDMCIGQVASLETIVRDLEARQERFEQLQTERLKLEKLIGQYEELHRVMRGNSFVEFIAEEQLLYVTRYASERLGELTRRRYALELDSEGGFIIRDDANGGVRRPVTSLSGGETFVTSLSLALALSAQIQLRGQHPLQFFFLDEGFGTLDQELLDVVISSLERLRSNDLAIGVISHVQQLRARMPRRLIVQPAEPSGEGTKVRMEVM